MRTVQEYLRHADECEKLLGTSRTDEEREMIRQMRDTWLRLARERKQRRDDEQRAGGKSQPSQ